MKNLSGKISGRAIEKYPQNGAARYFDFSVEVPESDEKDEVNDCYYSLEHIQFDSEIQNKRQIFQIDPIGAFVLGVWSIDYQGVFIQSSKTTDEREFIGEGTWNGNLSGRGYLRNLNDISDIEVEFAVELSNSQVKKHNAELKYHSYFKLKSLDGTIIENYPIFSHCPMKSFLLAVSLIEARVSYFSKNSNIL